MGCKVSVGERRASTISKGDWHCAFAANPVNMTCTRLAAKLQDQPSTLPHWSPVEGNEGGLLTNKKLHDSFPVFMQSHVCL